MTGNRSSSTKLHSKSLPKKRARTKKTVDIGVLSSAAVGQSSDSKFTCFKKLPPEIRRKIWKLIANQGRLIEVKQVWDNRWERLVIDVFGSSRQAPAVFQVCKESRVECMKLYRMINLRADAPNLHPEQKNWLYYNPDADIIFFGRAACVRILKLVFKLGLELRRIAINLGDSISEFGIGHAWNFIPLGKPVTACLMLLHGYHTDNLAHPKTREYPGCKGLKEVFLINRPGLLHPEFQDGDEWTELYMNVEGTAAEMPWKIIAGEKLKPLMDRIESGEGLESTGQNKWTGFNIPSIHVAHFNYHPLAPKVCEPVFLKYTAGAQLRRISVNTTKFARSIGCKVFFASCFWDGPGNYAIKIMGSREGVKKVKEHIAKMCKPKNRVGGTITSIERAEACCPETFRPYANHDDCSSKYI